MKKNFTEKFNEGDAKDHILSLNKKVGIAFVALFLTVVLLNTTGCAKKDADVLVREVEVPEYQEPITLGNDGVKAGIAGDTTDDVEMVSSQTSPGMISLTIENTGRANPFMPEGGGIESIGGYISVDMIAPPDNITQNTDASTVITTKVTGILYDMYKPSAILNLEGSDYLVRAGDYIKNYKVLSIGRNNVTVQLGANVYKAGVGELFSTDGINHNTISNLETKFGSSKNK